MSDLIVREMKAEDEYFITTCSHINELAEIDTCTKMRRQLLAVMKSEGTVFKVAMLDDKHIGFSYGIPIERSLWGPLGQSLMVIPCLYVLEEETSHAAKEGLIASIEMDARAAGCHGVTITAYRDLPGAEWFMPASFFELTGYIPVETRGREILLWKPFLKEAVPPHFLQPHYIFQPIEGAVVVDLFWNAFCQASAIEAQRVQEICEEFGDCVRLREFHAEDPEVLLRYQISRAIYVNGEEVDWGYEATKDGIREAIERAFSSKA